MDALLEKIDLNQLDKSTWETFRFEEITKRVAESVDPNTTDLEIYVGLEHIDPEDIHIKRYGTPDDVSGGKLKCYPGDVIFGKRRAYQRKAAIVDFEGICSAHAFVFRANPKVIDPKLFPFFLHSDQFMHRAVDISVGGFSPTINWGDLKGQEFLLPPKAEQARLAELLWAMDEAIQKEKAVLGKVEQLRDVSREKLFLYGIKSVEGEQNVAVKKMQGGTVPVTWKEKRFLEVVEITSGQVDPKKEEYRRLIQIGSERIEPNTGKITDYQTAEELGINSGNYLFTADHIIYSKIRPYFKKVANPNMIGLCSADIYPLLTSKFRYYH